MSGQTKNQAKRTANRTFSPETDKHTRTSLKQYPNYHGPYLETRASQQTERTAIIESFHSSITHISQLIPVELVGGVPCNPHDINKPLLRELIKFSRQFPESPRDVEIDEDNFRRTKLGRQEQAVLTAREAQSLQASQSLQALQMESAGAIEKEDSPRREPVAELSAQHRHHEENGHS